MQNTPETYLKQNHIQKINQRYTIYIQKRRPEPDLTGQEARASVKRREPPEMRHSPLQMRRAPHQ